ncbi:hypothetical protein CABS01_16946 [Colletotrichum abscissum]|uniref:uncharacterized protein n=1 Tax=Colletotrichum abscissum TaxID=1671311 RepID=UPI0027D73FCE|nr:uncharacterized protein CABS01_16946 [Colletotrichum abscissum]KAK1503121.1 hypothetical protein CABS01_16946 [Colletotrichum abscissum]
MAAPASAETSNRRPCYTLIHCALLSRDDRAMTLQEIYQWIQHNTGEDTTPSPSTIRYNLSTNKVRLKIAYIYAAISSGESFFPFFSFFFTFSASLLMVA